MNECTAITYGISLILGGVGWVRCVTIKKYLFCRVCEGKSQKLRGRG
jgi:hypothetical protein